MNKFLHQPLRALKNAAQHGDLAAIEAIRAAFAPNGNKPAEGAAEQNAERPRSSDEQVLSLKERND